MCGIFAIFNDPKHLAAETTLRGLKTLEYRGYDSWGIAEIVDETILYEKHVGKIGEANTILPKSVVAIGHTRWATHGGVTQENSHPHLSCDGTLAVIHNGIVENFDDLKNSLTNHQFSSQTDTEIIVHLVEEKMKTRSLFESCIETFAELQGSNAFVILSVKDKQIIACKNGSPLLVGKTTKCVYLSSDISALPKETIEFYPLENNEGVIISEDGVMIFDCKTQHKKNVSYIPFSYSQLKADKGNYPNFMLKEIMDEAAILERLYDKHSPVFIQAKVKIRNAKKIYLIGCGSAFHAGLIGQYFFTQHEIAVQTVYAHEFASYEKLIKKDTVVIAISQSGETADTLLAVELAKHHGAQIISVVNNIYSSLVRISDIVIPVDAGSEIAVVSTKAFIAQVITLFKLSTDEFETTNTLQLSEVFLQWIKTVDPQIQQLAKALTKHEHIFIIGKGIAFPVVLESALKIKETSYVHAEGFASGELKHGVISMIETGTPCIVFCTDDQYFQDTLSGAIEIASRGGHIIGVSSKISEHFTEYIEIPKVNDFEFLFQIVVGQLLGYYMAIAKGLDPDKPRNLAKSVTVK